MLDMLAFDADDTLWHNENLYRMTQTKFKQLLAAYQTPQVIDQYLYDIEIRNLSLFGYGVKGFTLSMIETAIQLSDGSIQGKEIQAIIDLAKKMLTTPLQLLDGVAEVVPLLAQSYPLMLITKGDLLDQESKIARSGLAPYFSHIKIVSRKDEETFQSILDQHGLEAESFLMVGNSLKSDVLPVLAIGGHAVHIPYHVTWAHEQVPDLPPGSHSYHHLERISLLPELISTF